MIRLFQGLCVLCVVLAGMTPAVAETYGEGVTLEETTPIAELMANPASFDGKTVRVEGKVNAVCERMGCWMLLEDEGGEVRVKVEDGVIVFPAEAIGKMAVAQGEVSAVSMEREEWVAWQKHLAEEAGDEFDDTEVGEGPFLRVQIAGTGAEIPVS
jgi:hypothetical protein